MEQVFNFKIHAKVEALKENVDVHLGKNKKFLLD